MVRGIKLPRIITDPPISDIIEEDDDGTTILLLLFEAVSIFVQRIYSYTNI